jgi:hypothetical protein
MALPRPTPRAPRADPTTALQHEVHELRLAVAALRAEVAMLHERAPAQAAAAPESVVDLRGPAAVTLVLPLARAAALAGVPADGVVSLDLGTDTAPTEIVLPTTAAPAPIVTAHESLAPRVAVLPEAPLLDPRLARVADVLDDLLGDDSATVGAEGGATEGAKQPVGAAQRETA